jgi:sulfatase maturation enzyme AslB (radical SAM superfamily)
VQFIVEYAVGESQKKSRKIDFSLVTNLTIMTEEKLTWLLDNNVNVCTSLDGNEVLHNENRT